MWDKGFAPPVAIFLTSHSQFCRFCPIRAHWFSGQHLCTREALLPLSSVPKIPYSPQNAVQFVFSGQVQNHEYNWNQHPDSISPDRVDSLLTITGCGPTNFPSSPSCSRSLRPAGLFAVLGTHQTCSCPKSFARAVPLFLECSSSDIGLTLFCHLLKFLFIYFFLGEVFPDDIFKEALH